MVRRRHLIRVENTPSVIHAERALPFSRSFDRVSPFLKQKGSVKGYNTEKDPASVAAGQVSSQRPHAPI